MDSPTFKNPAMLAPAARSPDSAGYVYDKDGIDLPYMKDLKEVRRGRIMMFFRWSSTSWKVQEKRMEFWLISRAEVATPREYAESHPGAAYHTGCRDIWSIPCGIALPCATQNELDLDAAKTLKLGHEALAEAHDLQVRAALGVEVAAPLAAADGQAGEGCMLQDAGRSFDGETVVISGSGNVALYGRLFCPKR